MIARFRPNGPGVTLVLCGLAYIGALMGGWRIAYNGSESMPRGIYLLGPAKSIARGELVEACIPSSAATAPYGERNYLPVRPGDGCSSGLAHIVKPVAAIGGDLVSIEAGEVVINGVPIGARISSSDRLGRPLAGVGNGWCRRLEAGEFFLVSSWSPSSLDSRYFGPVSLADIHARAWKLVTE